MVHLQKQKIIQVTYFAHLILLDTGTDTGSLQNGATAYSQSQGDWYWRQSWGLKVVSFIGKQKWIKVWRSWCQ